VRIWVVDRERLDIEGREGLYTKEWEAERGTIGG